MRENDNTTVTRFLKKFLVFLENAGFEPVYDSPAAVEIRSFKRHESVETAFSQAVQAFISATDYLEALDTLVSMGNFAMAPWSCARGMIEASAISTWLFEMGIGPKERVCRSLSLRYATLREQEKMARYNGDNNLVQKIRERIESIEKIAIDLGFPVLRDKKGQRIGIAQIKPNMTTLIEKQFKGENLYRMFSGMAHSDYTSLTALSFIKTDLERRHGALLIRAVPTEIQSALVSHAVTIYAKCAWLRTIQFGLDAAKVAILLEELYNELRIADTNNDRFWRTLIYNRS
jgi:hypothetical protein